MGDIKYETMDLFDEQQYEKEMEEFEDYEDYKDIVIEVDEKILKFISSFKIGSFLSLDVLVSLADKYECPRDGKVFYSNRLYGEHIVKHTPNPENDEELNEYDNHDPKNYEDFNENEKDEEMSVEENGYDDSDEDYHPDDTESFEDDLKPIECKEEASTDNKLALPFKCEICDETFLKQSWLVRHCFSHAQMNEEEYACFHCTNVYRGKFAKSSYKKHIDRLITAEEERACDTCGHMAKTKEFLEVHMQVKHLGLKRFKCEIDGCVKEFSLNKYLIKHRRIHDTSTSYQCNECEFSTNLSKNLQRHIARQHLDKQTLDLNCDECGYAAPNKDRLQTHKRNHHSGQLHECTQCDKKYRDRGKYLLHIKRDHQGVRYKCESCDQEFTHKHTLVTHIKRMHEGLKLKCEKCDHEATSRRALRWHILKTHEKNPFSCDICPFVGSNYPFLYSHKNKIHFGVRYHCDLCEHVSYNETLLKHHMKENHPDQEPNVFEHQKTTFNVEDYPRCQPCNKLFQTRKRYLNHNTLKHGESGSQMSEDTSTIKKKPAKRKQVNCPTCGKKLTTERRLERHMVLHHPSLLQCTKCDESFTDKRLFIEHKNVHRKYKDSLTACEVCSKEMRSKSLAKHIKIFHSEVAPEKKEFFTCPNCQMKCNSEERLERHMYLNHSSVMQCSDCGKSFTDKKVFINHQKWHRYDTPTACEVCGKELKRSSLLKHMQMHHSEQRPAKNNFCDICGKSFYVKATLVIHMKKHNNQKDIFCTFDGCNMAFYTTGHMKDHTRVHTGQAIRQCATCLKEFKSMSAYRYHIKRIHPVIDNADMLSSASPSIAGSL